MKRLLLMACSVRKDTTPGLMPALYRYDGPAFRSLRFRRGLGFRLPKILILSAKYGLIESTHPIENYDVRMDPLIAASFMADARSRREVNNACWAADRIFIFGGALYRKVFLSWLPTHAKESPIKPILLDVECSKGFIGEQLSQLRAWLQKTDGEL